MLHAVIDRDAATGDEPGRPSAVLQRGVGKPRLYVTGKLEDGDGLDDATVILGGCPGIRVCDGHWGFQRP
jgi:hypothetical protein